MSDSAKPSLLVEQKRVEAILNNKNTVFYWKQRKKEYEEAKESLQHYTRKLQEHVMVPIGRRGLMRGRIVNTNQVFVPLGANWFIKVCSSEAQELCARKILESNDMLEKLDKERKILEGWTALSNVEVFANEESKEIIEHYDAKEEEVWRKKHSEKVKEHRKKLAEVRDELEQRRMSSKSTEEELFRRLDLLEIQEEFEDELERIGEISSSEDKSSTSLDSDDDSNAEEESSEQADNPHTLTKKAFNDYNKIKEYSENIHEVDNLKKKVTFDVLPNATEKECNKLPNSPYHISLGQVVEHSNDLAVNQQLSKDSRPISKFKSSRLKGKK